MATKISSVSGYCSFQNMCSMFKKCCCDCTWSSIFIVFKGWYEAIKYFLSLLSLDFEQREVKISVIYFVDHMGCNSFSSQFPPLMIQAAAFPPGNPGVFLCLVPLLICLLKLIVHTRRHGSA